MKSEASLRRWNLLLSGLSLVIILLSFNRLSTLTLGYLQPYEFLRLVDFNALLPIPLLSIVLYYLLKHEIVYETPFVKSRSFLLLNLAFIIGVYLFGASSGTHEVTNYLNTRFCGRGEVSSVLCNIISYNDDVFSHYVYYGGFLLLNAALTGLQYNFPLRTTLSKRDLKLILLNAAFIALGVFANLAFEPTAIDMAFFGLLAVANLYLLRFGRHHFKQVPLILYFSVAYGGGMILVVLYKLLT